MTKEQALKHKKVIEWWLDNPDKGVWKKAHGLWFLEKDPSFYIDYIYVQNDEYVEYRKALAEGKTIQFLQTCIGTHNIDPVRWLDWNSYGQCFDKYTQYRVKPEEPKFKVGDWVTVNNGIPLRFKRFTGNLPEWNKELNYEIVEFIKCGLKHQIPNFDRSIVKHWKPKKGEFCVFWDNNPYDSSKPEYYTVTKFRNIYNAAYEDINRNEWDNIAPLEFINTLKDK